MAEGPSADTIGKVWDRDGGACARCGVTVFGVRGLHYSFHHRRPRGAGSSREPWVNLPGNLLLLCGSGTTGCHGHVESYRQVAYDEGFLVRRNGVRKSVEVPIKHFRFGWVLLTDTGGWEHQEVPF